MAHSTAPFAPDLFCWWVADPDCPSWAMPVHSLDALESLVARGIPVFNSPAGCVLHAGVQASAFARPIQAEKVWKGTDVMDNGWSTKGIPPCGTRAAYGIVATPGRTTPYHPPLHPSQMAALAAAQNLPPKAQVMYATAGAGKRLG